MPDRAAPRREDRRRRERSAAIYYTALLVNVGCYSDAHEQAKWFGDDIALNGTALLAVGWCLAVALLGYLWSRSLFRRDPTREPRVGGNHRHPRPDSRKPSLALY